MKITRQFFTSLGKIGVVACLLVAGPASATTVMLVPVDDTYVYNINPTANFGSTPDLATGNLVSGNSVHRWTSFLKFDLSSIPDNLTITGATLHMYQFNGAGFQTGFGTNALYVANDSWQESTLVWNNQPTIGPVLGTSPDDKSYRGWSVWDLLATGQWNPTADQGDNLLSIAVDQIPASSSHNWCSKESDLVNCLVPGETGPVDSLRRPYLEITYVVPLPAAMWLFGSGILGLFSLRGKRPR